jgi:hypothetical protein
MNATQALAERKKAHPDRRLEEVEKISFSATYRREGLRGGMPS